MSCTGSPVHSVSYQEVSMSTLHVVDRPL